MNDQPKVCRFCNGTGIDGINRGEGFMPRCDACNGSGEELMGDSDEYDEHDLSHEFAVRLSEYGIAMAHRQGEKARVLSEVLQSMFDAKDQRDADQQAKIKAATEIGRNIKEQDGGGV